MAIFAVALFCFFARFSKASIESEVCLKTDLGDGRFKKVFKDGTMEIGEFKNEKLNGVGRRLFPEERIEATDDLERIEPAGKEASDIREQKGNFKDGILFGQGKIVFWNGRVYEGKFVNGKLKDGTINSSAVKGAKVLLQAVQNYEEVIEENTIFEATDKPQTQDKKIEDVTSVIDSASKRSAGIKVFIHNNNSEEKYEFDIPPINSILALKARIYLKHGIQIHRQRLIFGETILKDNQTLESYHLSKGAMIRLEIKT